VFLATLSLTACESTSAVIPTSASDVQSQGTLKSTFTAEPATLHAEFLPGVGCLTTPAFGTRIIVIVNGGTNVALHGVRFRFTDRTGLTALPMVTTVSGSTSTVPAGSIPPVGGIPIPGVAPLPSASPIPIPGSSQSFPFFLTFGCGFQPDGILVVSADSTNGSGIMHTTDLRMRLGL